MAFGLIVLDGWGYSEKTEGNAVKQAKTPNFDSLWKNNSHTLLKAHGRAVGLPEGYMGGSEVGHIHLGAGRRVEQEFTRINDSIDDGTFFENDELKKAFNRKRVHLMGLTSDAGVHSHVKHLKALIEMGERQGCKTFVHAFTDGRDTPPKYAENYLKDLEADSVTGRYFAMDRDENWKRTRKTFRMLTEGKGHKAETDLEALKKAYERGETDEFVEPTLVNEEAMIKPEDAIIFFNFRADRARQLTQLFLKKGFHIFTLTQYDDDFDAPVAFPPHFLKNTLGEWLSKKGLTQFRTAETQKYAHVTFFFNGRREKPFKKEERLIVPSPKVPTYDLQPGMNADKVTKHLIEKAKQHDFVLVNYANPDMVGHTGKMKAAIKAVEAVDKQLEKIIPLFDQCIILADHGNAERMKLDDGSPCTAHSTNPVPCMIVSDEDHELKEGGSLFNVASTVLELMGLKKPPEMTDSVLSN